MRFIVTIALVGLVTACEQPTPSNDGTAPDYTGLTPCEPPNRPGLRSLFAESLCGTVTVFEDREAAAGRTIDLNVMVIRATAPAPRPDPVFFLAGGPGQAATMAGPPLFSRLRDLRRERDVVLVDQRGTGQSNSLACETETEGLDALGTQLDELAQIQIDSMKRCLAEYDADPSLYSTPIAMDDLDEVRRELGFDHINLYGISYGTRAALVYLRRHEASVRSVILDGVVPLSMSIPENVALDAQTAFDRMLDACREQSACNGAFPQLQTQFAALLRQLEAKPEAVTLEHPRTGEPFDAVIEARLVTRVIRAALYDRHLTSLLPLSIREAHRGNFQPLVGVAYAIGGDGDSPAAMSFGMMTSVLCSEDMTLASGANPAPDFDNPVYDSIEPLCRFWPIGEIPENYFDPVRSDVPTLLVSGTLDPITPPKYGIEAEATLSNSTHVIVPGVGHGATVHGCLPDVVARFLDDPRPHDLQAACASDLARPPFFTRLTGPAHPQAITDD